MARKRKKTRRRKPRWTEAHVQRAFWRAGFGATEREAALWAARGRRRTLDRLVRGDGGTELRGPRPSADGKPLDPQNVFGHAALWWLDRMVRTTHPLEERMTLFWHDHFATTGVETPMLLRQNETFRKHALGSFDELLRAITLDPAMMAFLNTFGSHKRAPNENYARELMELFTLGTGYSEQDVREAARALTGYVEVRQNGRIVGHRFDPARHDDGEKTIFGRTGRFGMHDVLRLCLEHPNHAPFMAEKLWSHFITAPIQPSTRTKLARAYRASGYSIATLVRRILDHPRLYDNLERGQMVKAPAVFVASELRRMEAPVALGSWTYRMASMGQQLFSPPSVAGWDWGAAWMSSNATRARFVVGNELMRKNGPLEVRAGTVDAGLSAADHLELALRATGRPRVSRSTRLVLNRMIAAWLAAPEMKQKGDKPKRHVEELQRALRHLIVTGPENQVC